MSEDNGNDQKKHTNKATGIKKHNLNPGRLNPYKSLASYLKYLEGEELTVELKNGRQFTGILQHAEEPSMNLTLALPVALQQYSPLIAPVGMHTSSSTVDPLAPIPPKHEFTSPSSPSPLPQFRPLQLRGAAIRYIHFTADDYLATIRANQDRERSANQKYQRALRK